MIISKKHTSAAVILPMMCVFVYSLLIDNFFISGINIHPQALPKMTIAAYGRNLAVSAQRLMKKYEKSAIE